MLRSPRRAVPLLVAAVALAALPACVHRLDRTLTAVGAPLDHASPFLKAHLKDGRVYILSRWAVDEARHEVSGDGALLGLDRREEQRGHFTVALADVAIFETNVVQTSGSVAALAVLTGASLALTAACLLNPKACFGSCPTFYASDGDHLVLQAEGFSDSISPALEATDVDALFRTHATRRALALRMTNEALETHIVKQASVLALARPADGGRVYHAVDERFWQAGPAVSPTTCAAAEGDCRASLAAMDQRERFSAADPDDLASRETIELGFAPPRASGRLGIVLTTRQTLLSTFVLYQGLAYMGGSIGTWLTALETRDPKVLGRARNLLHVLGGIEVQTLDAAGAWVTAGEIDETGPLAEDVHLVVLPAGSAGDRIRLRLTKGHWRIDQASEVALGAEVQPIRLAPIAVVGTLGPQFAAGRTAATRLPIVTQPGDAYTLRYQLPAHPERYELFLETRGYYLEWMRQEWLSEENTLRATQLVIDPAGALRAMAPRFKQLEAGMEQAFWRSRYANP